MTTVGLFGALVAGVLSLLSPCSALLLPAFFAYAFSSIGALVGRTLVFLAGLAAVLVPVGAGAGSIGALLTEHRSTLILVGGWVIIALGVYTALGGGFRIPGVSGGARGTGPAQVFLLGAVYGFAGFCAGPLLGAVLTTAAVTGSPFYGGLILGMYAVGMALPLFALALVWDRLRVSERAWLRPRTVRLGPVRTTVWALVSGALFIGIGALFLTSHGTATLPTLLSLDTQYEVQAWAQRATAAVGDATFWFWVSAAGTVVSGLLLRGSSRRSAPRLP